MNAAIQRQIYWMRSYSWLADARRFLPRPPLKIDRPIFLLGTQGGGLTLLSRMLRRHPDVISAAGNCHYWTSADELQNVFGSILPPELTGLRFKAPPHPNYPAPRSWTYAIDELLPHYRRRAVDATPELAAALADVIRFSAIRHALNRRKFRFVDKSQVFSVRLGLMHKLLEGTGVRFVLVPRDPYVSVYRAAHGKAADMRRLASCVPLERRIELCAEHYGNSMRAVWEDCTAAPVTMKIVPFETLVGNPASTLKQVCRFVDLESRADMLPAASHRFPLGTRFHERWYPIRPDVNAVYEQRLDQFTIDMVNDRCGDVMQWLGYRRRSTASLLPGRAAAA